MPTMLSEGARSLLAHRYEVLEAIGRGTSAHVVSARDHRTGQTRALKLFVGARDRDLAPGEFARLSRLEHPNLVRVHEVGHLQEALHLPGGGEIPAGVPFLVLDLIRGTDPVATIETAAAGDRGALLRRVIEELASALALLHRHGLVHHDVKPANVLLTRAGSAVLIDLGLATPFGTQTTARGTPLYMAPEALGGRGDHRVDLYGLGATALHLATGRPPFAGRGAALVRAILEEEPRLAATWLDEETTGLVLSLLRKDPLARPASAHAVLTELARIRGDHDRVAELVAHPPLLPPAFVGRQRERHAMTEALLARRDPLLLVVGSPGSGRSRLVAEAIRQCRIREAAAGRSALEVLEGLPEHWLDPLHELSNDGAAVELADRLERRARRHPQVLVLRPDDRPLARRLVEVIAGGAQAPPLDLIAIAKVEPDDPLLGRVPRAAVIELEPLDPTQVRALAQSMVGTAPDQQTAGGIHRLSGGHPALAIELSRQWAQSRATPEAGVELSLAPGAGIDAVLASRRRQLGRDQQRLLDAVAVMTSGTTGWAPLPALMTLLGTDETTIMVLLEPLLADGSLTLHQGQVALPSAAHRDGWLQTAGSQTLLALHRRAAQLADDAPQRRAWHLLQAKDPAGWSMALEAGRKIAGRRPGDALAWVEPVARGAPAAVRQQARQLLGELYVEIGRYDEALTLLDPQTQPLGRAQALLRKGDYAEAEALLGELLPRMAAGESRDQGSALLGQVMLRKGRPSEALDICGASALGVLERGQGLSSGSALLVEVAGLAHFYLGHLEEADRLFARASAALAAGDEGGLLARFDGMRGMVAFASGQLERAATHYHQALERAQQAGDVHGVATYLGNLGSTLVDLGRYAEALTRLTAATRQLGRLGRTSQLAAAVCNHASLLIQLGDLRQAEALARRGAGLAEGPVMEGFVALLEGDIRRRRREIGEALVCYQRASSCFVDAGARREQVLARLLTSEMLTELGRADEGRAILDELSASETEHRGALTSSRARWALSQPDAPIAQGLTSDLARHCAELERRGARAELWRAASLLGRLLLRRQQTAAARAALRRASATWESVMADAPEIYRDKMNQDLDARALAEQWDALGVGAADGASGSGRRVAAYDHQRLRRLLSINKRLNSELHLPRLLELIIDTVIELTDAERGFLILVDGEGTMEISVARNIDQRSLAGDDLALSRSIAEEALRQGVPVVAVDAADDGRFAAAISVSDLRLRSVLAVPLSVKGRTVGTIYIDHRLRRGVFGETEVMLVQDFADQAAIAIDNARLLEENNKRQTEIEALNRQLSDKVESQRAELSEVHQQLRSSKQALKLRYDYANIVGNTPRMQEMFRLIDRVTDTDLPVVVQGESGTGKELVARAIHFNGPRAAEAFVSENCGAIPETLLESVLFGYERGAFTGAERDRRGLFEVASGGTLFLDEVGEMSPAMQTKLLRVLQDGEFRRVGSERTLTTDVRVIAASNQDLSRLVERKAFREDLFYRLNVIRINIPALRERREDIPLLVEHLLEKHAPGRALRLTSAAMALLAGYAWPGNVRELENEIMRVAALAGEVIGPEDLSPQLSGAVPLTLGDGDDLALKPRVEHLEKELIRRALTQSGNNQSAAARLLGLSRYGLLKKIKRYFGDGAED